MVLRLLEIPQFPQTTGTVDEVELCLKILSTNCLCSPSLTLIFSYNERPPRRVQETSRDFLFKLSLQIS